MPENNLPIFLKLSKEDQKAAVEAIIFASEEPVTLNTLYKILIKNDYDKRNESSVANINIFESSEPEDRQVILEYNFKPIDFLEIINEINRDLQGSSRPYHIINISGGYQFATRAEYGELIQQLIKYKTKRKLTQASLETLAIIAYKQPITKTEIEQIRGVSCGDVINSLIEKKFVDIVGRKDTIGRPLLFGTTPDFLKFFGLNSLNDLPELKELDDIANELKTNSDEIAFTFDIQNSGEEEQEVTDLEPNNV
ncbi:MAG: SMC-Scp complex subunit ScpB [Candidatus Kapabacteria bacterium]|nr:SMC-Scp complex subunit ScpB [Candidatus Kapabacteria bacterium]